MTEQKMIKATDLNGISLYFDLNQATLVRRLPKDEDLVERTTITVGLDRFPVVETPDELFAMEN